MAAAVKSLVEGNKVVAEGAGACPVAAALGGRWHLLLHLDLHSFAPPPALAPAPEPAYVHAPYLPLHLHLIMHMLLH